MPFGQWWGVRVSDLEPSYCENLLRRWKGDMAQSLRSALEEVRDRKAEEVTR